MDKLDEFIARRQAIAARYDELLAGLPLELPPRAPAGFGHGYHLYAVRVPHRRAVYDHLHAEGIAVQVHYVPIHHHPVYRGIGEYPATDRAYAGLLSLPMYPTLTGTDQERVAAALADALRIAA